MIEKVLEALLQPVQAHRLCTNSMHRFSTKGIASTHLRELLLAGMPLACLSLSLLTLILCSFSSMEELLIQNRCLCVRVN